MIEPAYNLTDLAAAAVETGERGDLALERLAVARARFLRHLARTLAPTLPLLVDRGRWALQCAPGLLLRSDGVWVRADRPKIDTGRVQDGGVPLDDVELGRVRIDPENLLNELGELLARHVDGRSAAEEKLLRLARAFEAIVDLVTD